MDFIMKLDFMLKNGGNRLQENIIGRLSTGNVWVDTVVAASIPIVMHLLLPGRSLSGNVVVDALFFGALPFFHVKGDALQDYLLEKGMGVFWKIVNKYETTITFEKMSKSWLELYMAPEEEEEGGRNNILQKAILLYIGNQTIKFRRSQASLTTIKEKPEKESEHSAKVYGGTAEQLKRYKISVTPPRNMWVLVDKENNIYFKQTKVVMIPPARGETRYSDYDIKTNSVVAYKFWCDRAEGDVKIEAFINKAYEWYTEEMKLTEDHARYTFNLVAVPQPSKKGRKSRAGSGDDSDGGSGGDGGGKDGERRDPAPLRYKKYKLGDLKDFDSLFFPEKDSLLKILGNFEAKKGLYSIKGYPHKLGLLLHGPPGTGKTSLIKAMACHTKRHIVQVPLGRVSTNQDLMNIMFDQSFSVVKQELPIEVKFENVIFVFEDVDAASKIVRARKKSLPARGEKKFSTKKRTKKNNKKHRQRTGDKGTRIKASANGADDVHSPDAEPQEKTRARVVETERDLVNKSHESLDTTLLMSENSSVEGDHERSGDDSNVPIATAPDSSATTSTTGDIRSTKGTKNSVSHDVSSGDYIDGEFSESDHESSSDNESDGDSESDDSSDVEVVAKEGTKKIITKKMKKKRSKQKYADKFDKLDLAGLLNVLDGVVDTPGRIVIMTTNQVDVLDPALIRPGRIDKTILLDYMKYPAALQMTKHFFPDVVITADQESRLEAVLSDDAIDERRKASQEAGSMAGGIVVDTNNGHITPAMLEQMAGEFDQIEAFLDALEGIPSVMRRNGRRK